MTCLIIWYEHDVYYSLLSKFYKHNIVYESNSFFVLFILSACKNPDAVKKYMKEDAEAERKKALSADTVRNDLSKDQILNADLLTGHWTLDITELKEEVRNNSKTKKQAELLINDFDRKYSSIELEFYDDKRFALYVNGNPVKGIWGISSDKVSYYIQLADDFIELHEVISLTDTKLIEIPVAQMRSAGLPLKRIVYLKG